MPAASSSDSDAEMAKFASIAVEGIAIKEQAAQSAAHAQQQIVAPDGRGNQEAGTPTRKQTQQQH